MRKIFELDDRFPTGEPTIQLVMTADGRGGRFLEKRAFDSAAESPAYEFLKTVTPKAGHSIVLVNALGAYEAYDDNRNGDSFPDSPVNVGVPVRCGHPGCQGSAWIDKDETLKEHFKSFEKHGGIFVSHVNKDKSKSRGDVLKAIWNSKMRRVELLLDIVNERDPVLAKKIGDGEYPAVSMGCHVRWDVCSICGHRAPTRKDYCDHARNKMRQILSNGEKVCVHNPSPRFFDISFVFRPADPTGFMLKKVAEHGPAWIGFSAEAGERADALEQKIADVRKLSDIRKELLGRITASRYAAIARANAKARKPASDKELAKLAAYPLSVIVSTFAAKNAALSTSDVSRLFLKRAGMNTPDWLIDRLVAIQPIMTEAFAQAPSLLDKVASLIEVDARHVNPGLFPLVDDWTEKHAGMSDYLEYQAFGGGGLPVGPGAAYRMSDPPRTDILTLTDPNTGHMLQTTRGAAQQAHHADMKHKLFGTALLAAVYAGGLHAGGKALLKPKVPLWLTLPAAAYLGHKTYEKGVSALSPLRNQTYLTDQGIEVPGNTEFVKTNAYRPALGTEVAVSPPVLMDKLAFDIIERVGDRPDPVRALVAKVASHAPRAAISSFLLLDADDTEKAAALCEGVEVADGVDMLLLAERVGSLLLS